jgi:hypothetical protein
MIELAPFLEADKAARAGRLLELEVSGGAWGAVPGLDPLELYETLPRGKSGRNGYGVRAAFSHLRDPRTKNVSRRTLERLARVAGLTLPEWADVVLSQEFIWSAWPPSIGKARGFGRSPRDTERRSWRDRPRRSPRSGRFRGSAVSGEPRIVHPQGGGAARRHGAARKSPLCALPWNANRCLPARSCRRRSPRGKSAGSRTSSLCAAPRARAITRSYRLKRNTRRRLP